MKNLPKVYVKPFDREVKNNKEMYYSSFLKNKTKKKDILKEIDSIFHSKDFVYKSRVEITTLKGTLEESIIGRTQGYLLTYDGKKIPIATILDIKKI